MNKRVFAAICALTMSFTLLAGCVGRNVATVGTINGKSIYKADFEYFLQNEGSTIAQSLGVSDDSWTQMEYNGKNALDAARDEAFENLTNVMAQAQKAYDEELISEKEAQSQAKQSRQSAIKQSGGLDAYKKALASMGLDDEAYTRILTYQAAASAAAQKYESDDSIAVSDEEAAKYFDENYIRARHILISNADTAATGDEVMPTEEASEPTEAKAPIDSAKEVIAALDGGADFDALITQYNTDPGQSAGTSYVFGEGEMVSAFYNAAKALKVGEYTKEPVETSYGYHIIERMALSSSDKEYADKKDAVVNACKADKFQKIVDEWKAAYTIERNDDAISKVQIIKNK